MSKQTNIGEPVIIESAPENQTVERVIMKTIAVVDVNSESIRDAQIQPGTTPSDLKRTLQLPGDYKLSAGPGREPFTEDTNIYLAVPNGAKLYAGSPVDVGQHINASAPSVWQSAV